ncbi:MAG: FprA family A-type flavoprotein [Candidatus Izimaplasma sp.]|nr:FprA family A-type flavoprotein [Candidatus Izimaplasma bacterium]
MKFQSLEIKENIFWVGAIDKELEVFDILMKTKYGTTYNSYLIKGSKKIALIDTAKAPFRDEFIERIKDIVNIEDIDYLIINHAEPDHSGSVIDLLEINPNLEIFSSVPGMINLKAIINQDANFHKVKEGETLSLGDKTLEFTLQPNLHWPDTMFTFLREDKLLFTCDFLGAHYGFEGVLHENLPSVEEYKESIKYYYDSIMSPFPKDVRRGIKKVKEYNPEIIAVSHGAVIKKPYLDEVIANYEKWSKEKPKREEPLVVIPFASAYKYTKIMAETIKLGIEEEFDGKVEVNIYDVVETKITEIVKMINLSDAFLIGSATLVRDAVKPIWDILSSLYVETTKNKLAGAFGSYGWSGEAVNNLTERLNQLKANTVEGIRIKFKPSKEQLKEVKEFGINFAKKLKKEFN